MDICPTAYALSLRWAAVRRHPTLFLAGLLVVAAVAIAVLVLFGSSDDRERSRAGTGPKLAWKPPALTDPQTVRPTASDRTLELDPGRDYRVDMPDEPLSGPGGLSITGGRNVVLIGGTIDIALNGAEPAITARRGLFLQGQTGTVHVEGLLIRGRDLSEGIDLDQRAGATVQLQNIRVEGVHALDEKHFSDNHPDVVQTWAGPAELRVDRLTGSTDYQGFFLHPTQFIREPPRLFDLRHVEIEGGPTSQYLLWQAAPFPLDIADVWIRPARGRPPAQTLWPAPEAWRGVRTGAPPGGDFVPAGVAGADYAPPGYSG